LQQKAAEECEKLIKIKRCNSWLHCMPLMFLSYFLSTSLPIGVRYAKKDRDRRKGREKMGRAGMNTEH